MADLQKLLQVASKEKALNAKLLSTLKKRPPHNLDVIFKELHNNAFDEINCLDCANCCKSLGPQIFYSDIEKLSKYLKIKPSAVIEKYLIEEPDSSFSFKTMPCPFLGADNYCFVYENRPKACREYPHTNRARMYQILDITLKNSLYCPAVAQILNSLKNKLKL